MEMPDVIKQKIMEIRGIAEDMRKPDVYVPSTLGWVRAGIASIPCVGGALDHLLFDKVAEIQQKNIEHAIEAMRERMSAMEEQNVSKEWFESEEALCMFSNLFQRILYESDKGKIEVLSGVFCRFGLLEHKDDPNKYAVLDIISKMTNNQRVIFMAVNEVPSHPGSVIGGDYVIGRWQKTIIRYCQDSEEIRRRLKGNINYGADLNILTSLNLLEVLDRLAFDDYPYGVSELGRLAYSYLTNQG